MSYVSNVTNTGNLSGSLSSLNIGAGWTLQSPILTNPNGVTHSVPLTGSLTSGQLGQFHSGMIGGYQFNQEMMMADTMGMLSHELLCDRPPGSGKVPDAIYPVDLDLGLPAIRYHLMIYRHSDPDRSKNFWNLVRISQSPSNLEGKISFVSRAYRQEFLRWWKKYVNRFFSGVQPVDVYLPKLKTGAIAGIFIEHQTMLDHVPYNQVANVYNSNMIRGLMETIPAWSWIAGNCRHPVCRTQGGWIFSNGAEGAKFLLFDAPQKTEISLD